MSYKSPDGGGRHFGTSKLKQCSHFDKNPRSVYKLQPVAVILMKRRNPLTNGGKLTFKTVLPF